MPRHNHRGHHTSAYARGGHRNISGGSSAINTHRADQSLIRCNRCDRSLRRFDFFKAVVARYEKKLRAGNDPTSIKAICKRCCQAPPSDLVDTRPRPLANKAPVERAACKVCRFEYPLTTTYFLRADMHLRAAGNRICFSCRNNDLADDAVEQIYAAEQLVPVEDLEANEEIAPYETSDDDLIATPQEPIRRIEDQDQDTRTQARTAARKHGDIITKITSSWTVARERRLTRRFLPLRQRLCDRKQQRIRAEWERLARLQGHDLAERQSSLHRPVPLDSEQPAYPADLAALARVANGVLPAIVDLRAARRFETSTRPVIEQSRSSDEQQDWEDVSEDDDNDAVIPMWHLSEEQKIQRQRQQRDLVLDLCPTAEADQRFELSGIAEFVDDDWVDRFSRFVSVRESTPRQELDLDFRRLCTLNVLHDASRAEDGSHKRHRADDRV